MTCCLRLQLCLKGYCGKLPGIARRRATVQRNKQKCDFKPALLGQAYRTGARLIGRRLELLAGDGGERRKILDASFIKVAMPLIDPDVDRLVRESLLDHQVRITIIINVACRQSERVFLRFEGKLSVWPAGEVQLYSEATLGTGAGGIQKNRSVQFLIIIEVSDYKGWLG